MNFNINRSYKIQLTFTVFSFNSDFKIENLQKSVEETLQVILKDPLLL